MGGSQRLESRSVYTTASIPCPLHPRSRFCTAHLVTTIQQPLPPFLHAPLHTTAKCIQPEEVPAIKLLRLYPPPCPIPGQDVRTADLLALEGHGAHRVVHQLPVKSVGDKLGSRGWHYKTVAPAVGVGRMQLERDTYFGGRRGFQCRPARPSPSPQHLSLPRLRWI